MQNENRMFAQMLYAARVRLADRNPAEIARCTDAHFDGTAFHMKCLGHKVSVRYPEYRVESDMEEWIQLVILHYLDMAGGNPLTGKLISFAQQKDGMVRGGNFDRSAEMLIESRFGGLDTIELTRRCGALGGVILDSNADFTAEFHFLPRVPLTLKIWFPDEDFPAFGRLFTDSSISGYLSIEDSVTMGDFFLRMLAEV